MPLERGNLDDNPGTPVKFGLAYDITATSKKSITLITGPCGGQVTNLIARARASFAYTTIFGGEPGQVVSHNGKTATQMIFDAGTRLTCPENVGGTIFLTDVSDVSLGTGIVDGKVLTVFPFAASFELGQTQCQQPTDYFYRVYVEDNNGNSGYTVEGDFKIRILSNAEPTSSTFLKACVLPYHTTE